jgi:cyclic-di-GMP phosphodiesterase TipF (flagellum assembly factor)
MAAPPRLDPALRKPLLSAGVGCLAAGGLAAVLPPVIAAPVGLVVLGGALLSALLSLDRARKREFEALAFNVGEFNVRLAQARLRLDGLQQRVDSEPLREADIAPTRSALAELTAEVGLLGGVLRDVATAVAEHESKLAVAPAATTPAAPVATAPAKPEPGGPARRVAAPLTADPDPVVDRELNRLDEAKAARLLAAFAAGGLEIHLQPIAALPQRRTVGYEALARLKLEDGSLAMPAEFVPAIERAGQGAGLDAQVLTQALAIAGHLNSRGLPHFVALNLSAGTWGDARALGAIARVLEAYRAQAARLVIDVPQRVYRGLDPTRLGILGAMSATGVRFALDQMTDVRVDPTGLADRGVAFLKVAASLLATLTERDTGRDIAMADFGQLLRRAGIEIIGERAETDRLVADLIELEIGLAQGFAIAHPKPVKPEIFQPVPAQEPPAPAPAPAAVAAAAPPRRPDPRPEARPDAPASDAPQRLPLRAVLRRA